MIPFGCERTPLGAVKRTDLRGGCRGGSRGTGHGPTGVKVGSDWILASLVVGGGVEVGNIGFDHRDFVLLVCRALLAPQEGRGSQLPPQPPQGSSPQTGNR